MSLSWSTVEDAIHAWVRVASGLSAANVRWADQEVGQPATSQFITLRLGDLLTRGAADELSHTYVSGNPNGSQVVFTVRGRRELAVSVQCFGGGVVSSGGAREVLSKVQTALALPSAADALKAAGLFMFDTGTVRNINALRDDAFEARAILEVRFYLTEDVTENTTWIEAIELSEGDVS